MKISELLIESEEDISTYLAILGHDIVMYETGANAIKQQYVESPTAQNKVAVRAILFEVNLRIMKLVNDIELWERLETNTGVDVIYDRFVTLYNDNDEFLENLN